jgi:hypothetical protein
VQEDGVDRGQRPSWYLASSMKLGFASPSRKSGVIE